MTIKIQVPCVKLQINKDHSITEIRFKKYNYFFCLVICVKQAYLQDVNKMTIDYLLMTNTNYKTAPNGGILLLRKYHNYKFNENISMKKIDVSEECGWREECGFRHTDQVTFTSDQTKKSSDLLYNVLFKNSNLIESMEIGIELIFKNTRCINSLKNIIIDFVENNESKFPKKTLLPKYIFLDHSIEFIEYPASQKKIKRK